MEFFNANPGDFFGVQPFGGNPGGMLQITTNGVNDNRNYVYFDRTATGGHERIDFGFDLLIGPQAGSADGGSIAFLDTTIFGATGGVAASVFAVPEDPAQIGVLGIGFDTWSNTDIGDAPQVGGGSGSAYNDITLYYNGAKIHEYVHPDQSMRTMLPNGVILDDHTWHRVEGTIDFIGQSVSMTINGLEVWDNLAVPGLVPFENRVMFGARTGGENEDFFIDNVSVQYINPVDIEPPMPVGPQPEPTAGNWSVREWNVFQPMPMSIADADAIIANPNLQNTTFVSDGMREVLLLNDPQAPGGNLFPNAGPLAKQPFVSNTSTDDNDFVVRAVAKVIIPEDGQYTFGFHSDDGARLTLSGADFTLQTSAGGLGTASGEVLEFSPPTGGSMTLGSTFMTAGEHDIEVIYYERAGGAFLEVFASPGVHDQVNVGADGFAPIGLKEPVVLAQGTLPGIVGQWDVVNVEANFELNNLQDAQAAIDGAVFSFTDTPNVINYHDPATNPDGAGRFLGDVPFPVDIPGVDNNDFALQATATVRIAEDGDYIFGFGSDDGARLCLDGADFTILNPGGPRAVTQDGECMEFNENTGNSDTFGTTHLAAGDYEISFLMWERAGGAWAEVYTALGSDAGLTFQSSVRLLSPDAQVLDLVVPAGLQLAGEGPPPVGIIGDYNNSGQVEQADLDLVLLNWGQPTPPIPDGWTNDPPIGAIDQEELDKVLLNWGATAALGGTAAVPEPSTVVLLLLAVGLGFGLVRKR